MTRIIGGRAGGRKLTVPPAGTRPTSDRVREAVFSALTARIDFDDARVLDLYAGSGALGLEALSRGAGTATLVDADAQAHRVIANNIAAVGLPGAVAIRGPVEGYLRRAPDVEIDLVFWDPPYADAEQLARIDFPLLTPWLAEHAIVVAEIPSRRTDLDWPERYSIIFERRYGETTIVMAGLAEPGSGESGSASSLALT